MARANLAREIGMAIIKANNPSSGRGCWFSPHMAAASRAIAERIPLIDLVLEVRDARIPLSSACKQLENYTSSSKRIIVLNKLDLANRTQLKEWMKYFEQNECISYGVNAHNKESIKQFLNFLQARVRELNNNESSSYTATILLLGIPNVGKSALANSLHRIGRISAAEKGKLKHATVSPHPGETRDISSLKIGSHPNIYILDTPGVLPPQIRDIEVCTKLALTGTIEGYFCGEKELARCYLAILNRSEEYRKWAHLSSSENDRTWIECSNSFKGINPKRQNCADHTQDFIVKNVRQTLFKVISSFDGIMEEEMLIEEEMKAVQGVFQLINLFPCGHTHSLSLLIFPSLPACTNLQSGSIECLLSMIDDMVLQGKSDPVKLRVLVIGYDPTFLANVSEFLRLLNHQVWTYTNPFIALSALRVRRNFYDLIITDLYLPDMDGLEVQKRVRDEFKLPLIIVSSDDREHVILEALKLGAAHYIVKPICFEDVKNLWKFVVNANRSPKDTSFVEEIVSGGEQSSEAISDDDDTSGDHVEKNSKRRRSTKEANAPKKAKLIWTQYLHARFLESIHFIGLERAVPKTILEVMNVEGLTRENVASHLQKYRQFLRRLAAKISVSKLDIANQSQFSRFTWGRSRSTCSRTSIFQQQPISGENLLMNIDSSSVGGPLFHANVHKASISSMPSFGNTSPFYPSNSLSNLQMQQPAALMGYPRSFQPANYSSVHGSGFQADNVQSDWSSANGFQTQPSPLTNHIYGNYNNYWMSPGFQYNNNYDNTSWNGTMGYLQDSSSIITNNYHGGLQMSSAASVGLAGCNSNPNPSMMVANHSWSSSTSACDANVFESILNNIDQNVLLQDMTNASTTGNMMFSNNNFSGVEDASSVGFDGFTTVEAAASTSNVADLSPYQNQTGEYFDELHDILFKDSNSEPVNQEEGKEVVNSYETSTCLVQENASWLEEPHGQGQATENLNGELLDELEFDWLDLLDTNTILENVSVDEEWKKFKDSIINQ